MRGRWVHRDAHEAEPVLDEGDDVRGFMKRRAAAAVMIVDRRHEHRRDASGGGGDDGSADSLGTVEPRA